MPNREAVKVRILDMAFSQVWSIQVRLEDGRVSVPACYAALILPQWVIWRAHVP